MRKKKVVFKVIDKNTIKHLQKTKKINLPRKKVDIPKDMRWNAKMFNSTLMQGIQAGMSARSIAQGLFPEIYAKMGVKNLPPSALRALIDRCIEASMRSARTMITEAENRGRLDSYNDLDMQGVVQKKVWIATPDDRTRESHFEIDGEEVEIGEEFSNGLMYPGDPKGDPSEVYNCRCSMRDHIVGFRRADGSISYIDYEREESMHDKQMAEERERREQD